MAILVGLVAGVIVGSLVLSCICLVGLAFFPSLDEATVAIDSPNNRYEIIAERIPMSHKWLISQFSESDIKAHRPSPTPTIQAQFDQEADWGRSRNWD